MTSQFPAAVIAAAQASHKRYYPRGPYASVSLAQWAIESAYGRSVSGKNNYFGIKATPAQISSGQATARWTQEFYDGAYHKVEQWFADYPDENGSFDAHAKLLATSPIYAAAQAATTPESYVRAMAKPYATAPNYADVILAVMRSQNLYQFDLPVADSRTPTQLVRPVTAPGPQRGASEEKTMSTTTINTAPATPTAPARVVPTANQPVRVGWGAWLEQLLVHETPLIEQAAQTGLSVAAGLIPGGIGTAALNLLGPTVAKEAVDGVINMLQGPLSSAGATLEIPASSTIATMAANVLNSTLPTFVSKAGAQLDSWLKAAVEKL